jgi:alpha-glucosidase
MNHEYPDLDEAYDFSDQYVFGDRLMVAPVTTPISQDSLLASKKVWLPEGKWIEWFTGKELSGPVVLDRAFAMDEIPVYAKAGSIIPMQPKMRNTSARPVDPLILMIFPGDTGSARIYEDQGNSLGYQKDEFTWTRVKTSFRDAETFKIEILPLEGKYPGMLAERGYEVQLPGWWPPVGVSCNGAAIPYSANGISSSWRYDGDKLMSTIVLPKFGVDQKVEVLVTLPPGFESKSKLLDGTRGVLSRLRRVMPLLNSTWPKEWSPDILVHVAQTGNRIGINPGNAEIELSQLRCDLPEVLKQIQSLDIDPAIRAKVLNHLSGILGQ